MQASFTHLRGLNDLHGALALRLLTTPNASSAVGDSDNDIDTHGSSEEGSSELPVAVVVGVGVVAIILVTIGVVLWRKERAISKSLVDYISFLRDSPPQTTASGDGGMSGAAGNSGEREEAPPTPSIFDSGSQNRRHHTNSSGAGRGATGDSTNNNANAAFESGSQHRSAAGNGSLKGVLTGSSQGSSNPTPRTESWASSSYFSTGMWDDPVIVAARIPLDKLVVESLVSRGGVPRLVPQQAGRTQAAPPGYAQGPAGNREVPERSQAHGDLGARAHRQVCRRGLGLARGPLCGLGSKRSDLKSKDILLDERMFAKVMDFGVSREQSDRAQTAGVGTLLWMAPEVMVGDKYDAKADMFSFGVVLSELDTHMMPYAHAKVSSTDRKVPDTAIIQMVSSGKIRVQFSEPTNDDDAPLDLATATEMEKLCKSCVAFDARDRPTTAEVLYQLQKVLRAFDDAEQILAELRACM